jgi:sister chromatid cohesion protein DCC1
MYIFFFIDGLLGIQGNFILSPNSDLIYFPASSLPVDPAARFADIFLTRPRWKAEDIVPFLSDIAVDSKERDKLLLKYARVNTDADGVWYTARTKYH